jgi:hypothetical protein
MERGVREVAGGVTRAVAAAEGQDMRVIGYHATPSEHRQSILKNGLCQSKDGRMGKGIYFVQTFGQAKRIGMAREGSGNFDIWKADLTHSFSIGEARRGRHPPWCGMDSFTEICVDSSYLFSKGAIKNIQCVSRNCQ